MSNALDVPTLQENERFNGIDEVISIIQQDLTQISWLQHSLGKVYPQKNVQGSLEPWIYKGKGEYYKAYPNDTLNSFSCLLPDDVDQPIDAEGYFRQRTVSVICWVNFAQLGIGSPSVEKMKQDVVIRMRDLSCVLSIGRIYDQATGGAGGIYSGFDTSAFDVKFLTYPFGGFRIELLTHYSNFVC